MKSPGMGSLGKTSSGMTRPPAVCIRPMSAGDIGRVLEIAEGLPDAPHWTASAYFEAIDSDHRPLRVSLVAADAEAGAQASARGDAPIGFLVASVAAPEAELETIAVAAEGRRRGVGSLLLGALLEALRRAQVTELRLEVRASNQAALRFYRAQGFAETGRRPRYYANPEEDAVLLGLRLG